MILKPTSNKGIGRYRAHACRHYVSKFFKLTMSLISVAILAACTTTKSSSPDKMCGALKEFANAHVGTPSKSVILKTCWNCGETMIWKHCEAFEYTPGKKLCSYLLQHAYTEFPQDNFDRAIHCLADNNYQPIQNAVVELNHISYDFYNVTGIPEDIYISIEFSNGTVNEELPTLIIETSSKKNYE